MSATRPTPVPVRLTSQAMDIRTRLSARTVHALRLGAVDESTAVVTKPVTLCGRRSWRGYVSADATVTCKTCASVITDRSTDRSTETETEESA